MHHTVMVVASLCPFENKKEESKPHHNLADVTVKVTSQFMICLILISPPPWLNLEAPKWRQELPFYISCNSEWVFITRDIWWIWRFLIMAILQYRNTIHASQPYSPCGRGRWNYWYPLTPIFLFFFCLTFLVYFLLLLLFFKCNGGVLNFCEVKLHSQTHFELQEKHLCLKSYQVKVI